MRRMMHAAMFFLASAPLLQAQTSTVKPLPPQPLASHSLLSLSSEVRNDKEVVEEQQVPASKALPTQSNPASFLPRDSGRPYSQLLGYMSCSDWSPNLWNGYSSERAAKVAVINQHSDMQCRCFDCKKNSMLNHAAVCGSDGCSLGDCFGNACKGKVGAKIVNRYRQSLSTLHVEPSDSCGAACGPACSAPTCVAPAACNTGTCDASAVYPAAQTQPAISMQPSRPRMANPVIRSPRSAMNVQDTNPNIDSRR
jgi:hypothetical protein